MPATLRYVVDGAAYLETPNGICAILANRAPHLPNGIQLRSVAGREKLLLREGSRVLIGNGSVVSRNLNVRIAGWRQMKPAIPQTARLMPGRCTALLANLPPLESPALIEAERQLSWTLALGDLGAACEIVSAMIGHGSGLTPSGDDVVVGLLAAVVAATDSRPPGVLGHAAVIRLVRAVDAMVARGATTSLSGTLLEHAGQGNLMLPAHDALGSLYGLCDPRAAFQRLLEVGHRSGGAVARGLVLGSQAAMWSLGGAA